VNLRLSDSGVFQIQVSVVCYAVTAGAVHRGHGTVQCETDDRVSGYEQTMTYRISPERKAQSDFSLPVQWIPHCAPRLQKDP
jgi:hypothetical protein